MNELNKDEPDNHKISSIIETDVTLTYRLLKLVNSSFSLVSQVNSINHALSILGTMAFKKWLTLAMVQVSGAHKPPELLKTSLIRSAFMERIAKDSSLRKNASDINLIGILSVIDALLEKPMHKVLEALPLSLLIKDTLLNKSTKYSPVYDIVKAYEKGDFDSLEVLSRPIHYDYLKAPKAYYESLKWAEDLYTYMNQEEVAD
jgi:EAL and modified HD-GYP domain-containing signal transduction protein